MILPENNSFKWIIWGQMIFSDLEFNDKSIYDGSRISTSLLFELIVIFGYFRRKPKILVVQFYQKTDMAACHRRAYLF